ncbi:MAG TPA: peptidoglycan DD-metalloendopeptidase family protein [Actinocrinis sp.]|jgi:murein DD-endopeptidase MepM/ murein hydrolase activator NlpD
MKIIALFAGFGLLLGAGGPAVPAAPSHAADRAPGPPEQQVPTWSWPLSVRDGKPPPVVRPFRPPARRWLPGHRGVDLAAPPGAAVLAAGAGTVAFAGTLFGEGVVVVSHGGVRTSYEPVAAGVHTGQRVARGDLLGTLATDSLPRADPGGQGTVLHWGLLTGRGHTVRYYDPLLLLGFGHLRLEPAAGGAGPPSS